jgi:hypothetical protein
MDEAEFSERFREVADTFCRFIFQESCMKTVIGGHTLTGESESDIHLQYSM